MRVVVTGREGQVVRALLEVGAEEGVTVVPIGRPDLELSGEEPVLKPLAAARPDLIVNAAAFTAVDKAESEPDLARAVNATGAGAVAIAAATLGVPVIQLSTDYVFDGLSARPYIEDDSTGPLGVYGSTKLLGEQAVAAANARCVIARTAWVYAPFGTNFVRTMLRLAATRDEVGVVADQRGCPTAALDIARALLAMAGQLVATPDPSSRLYGTFHLTGQGEAVWADVAEAIFACSAARGGPTARVRRITTADYPTPARRPPNSRLNGGKLARTYGVVLPDWRLSVAACVDRLLSSS